MGYAKDAGQSSMAEENPRRYQCAHGVLKSKSYSGSKQIRQNVLAPVLVDDDGLTDRALGACLPL